MEKNKTIEVMFQDWNKITVEAPNEKVAEILAKAEYYREYGRTQEVLSFRRIRSYE